MCLYVLHCRASSERELPPFIVCTQELLSVKLLDSGIDDLQLRLAYSVAIIRYFSLAQLFKHYARAASYLIAYYCVNVDVEYWILSVWHHSLCLNLLLTISVIY